MPKIYKTQIYEMPNSNLQNAKSLQKTNLKFTKYQITQECKTIKPKISQITTIKYHNYILTTIFVQLHFNNYILTTIYSESVNPVDTNPDLVYPVNTNLDLVNQFSYTRSW